jgi:hypothetical protein
MRRPAKRIWNPPKRRGKDFRPRPPQRFIGGRFSDLTKGSLHEVSGEQDLDRGASPNGDTCQRPDASGPAWRQAAGAATARANREDRGACSRSTRGFQRTGGVPWAIATQSNTRSRRRRHFSRSALARLAGKIAPGRRRAPPRNVRVIVVNGRTVTVQQRRAAFAV